MQQTAASSAGLSWDRFQLRHPMIRLREVGGGAPSVAHELQIIQGRECCVDGFIDVEQPKMLESEDHSRRGLFLSRSTNNNK